MGLKILHSADWHLDSHFGGFDLHRQGLLRQELRQIPWLLADLCCREECHMVLLSGDIFDGVPSRDTVEEVKQALLECGVPVFISPGNHDPITPGSPWREVWPENVYIFSGDMDSVPVPELDCRVWGAGYRAMDCPPLLEGFRAEAPERYQIGVLHADPLIPDSPCCPVTGAQVKASKLHYLALGHIHKAGANPYGETLCAWPGCPMGRGWDETGQKGAYIVELDDTAKIRQVQFPGVRFYDETLDLGEDPLAQLQKLLPAGESEDYFRITLTGTGIVDAAALTAAFPGIPNLWIRDFSQPPVDLWATTEEDTLEGTYFWMLRELAEGASGRDREQILLAAQISRRLLDGREVELP